MPEGVLDGVVVDSAARDFLTRIGLPETFLELMMISSSVTGGLRTIAEVYAKDGDEPPHGSGSLLMLGTLGHAFLALNPNSGAVHLIDEDAGVQVLATDLERFVGTLARIGSLARDHGDAVSTAGFRDHVRAAVARHVEDTDPAVADDAKGAWAHVFASVTVDPT